MEEMQQNFVMPPRPEHCSHRTVQRLFTDLREVMNHPLPTVSALPLGDNLLEWHCNLLAHPDTPFEGGIFHVILKFPRDYPSSPPSLTLCTSIPHPNVHGSSLCLDMLSQFKERFQGWTPAYSALSVLLQLQAFLFKVSEDSDLSLAQLKKQRQYRNAIAEAKSFSCRKCSHRPGRPSPPLLGRAVPLLPRIALIKQALICFYTKQSYADTCLGVGISINRNTRTGRIVSMSSPLDLISLRSYMRYKVRKSAYNQPFSHWLPVFISADHARRALPMACNAISTIFTGASSNFEPTMALEIWPSLMRSMIVDMFADRVHISAKSLTGLFWFFRMLVEMSRQYPAIAHLAREKTHAFISSEANRHKDLVPDLANFLALYLLTDIPFAEILDAVLCERLDRNVFWLLQKYPELAQLPEEEREGAESEEDERQRITKSFVVAANSLRHILFFAKLVALVRPADAFCARVDENLGELPAVLEDDLMKTSHEILEVNTFDAFFRALGMEPWTPAHLVRRLRDCIRNSLRRGYHDRELEVTTAEDAAKAAADKVPTLESFLVPATHATVPSQLVRVGDGEPAHEFTPDEARWHRASRRFGIKALPAGTDTWRTLYLRMSLQETLGRLNQNPDFRAFYRQMLLSAGHVTSLEWVTFNPDGIRSRYFFLCQLLTKLPLLRRLVVARHSFDLQPLACKAITKGLQNNPASLEELIVSGCQMRTRGLDALIPGLCAAQRLEHLDLSHNPIGGYDTKCTKQLAKLFKEHPALRSLDLSACSLTDDDAAILAPAFEFNARLRAFRFDNNRFSTRGLGAMLYRIAFIPTLETLSFNSMRQVTAGSSGGDPARNPGEGLARLLEVSVSLREFNAWRTHFPYSSRLFDALAHNRSLVKMDLGETGFPEHLTSRLGDALTHNTQLCELNLERNSLSLQALYQLCKPGMRKGQRGFSVEALKMNGNHLAGTITITKRRRADLDDDEEEEDETTELNAADILRVFRTLRVLEMRDCQLDASSGAIIGGLLGTPEQAAPGEGASGSTPENAPLEVLILAQNRLHREGAASIARCLACNTTLRVLDLSSNQLGVAGARAVAGVLAADHPLEELNLFANQIGIEGCREIATALASNTHLRALDLGMNRIRDKGANALAAVLTRNATLESLKLRLNLIGAKGAHALVQAIIRREETDAAAPHGSRLSVSSEATRTSDQMHDRWGNAAVRELLLNNNPVPHEMILMICTAIAEARHPMTLDLQQRIAEADPDRRRHTVWMCPLPGGCSSDEIARFLYSNKCGAISNITICQPKQGAAPTSRPMRAARGGRDRRGRGCAGSRAPGRGGAAKKGKRFAFVEFMDENSVEVALHLPPQNRAYLRGQKLSIARAGIRTGRSVDSVDSSAALAALYQSQM